MYIEKISLTNFRNYEKQEIELNQHINLFYGNNAQGKTNMIEAIFICAYGKSFRTNNDKDFIQFHKDFSKIEIGFHRMDRTGKILANIQDKKTFYINDVKQNKLSDIIGKIHVVIFTPDDIEIIKDGPKKRRKFLDMMISSLRPNYLHLLNHYNKILEQRNHYLRQIKFENKDEKILDIWDEQLAQYAFKIYEYRKKYIEKIDEKLKNFHQIITDSEEEIHIQYISNGKSKETFLENLYKSRNIDIGRGFTGIGIHRDDFKITINQKQVAIFGSQGQQRTAVLTLKLCELEIMKEEIEDAPILLLDDFMSELDENRRNRFLENIKENQVIITCTDPMKLQTQGSIFLVQEGVCKKVE